MKAMLVLILALVGAGCETPVEPPLVSCQFVVTPSELTPGLSATEVSAVLFTTPGCGWTAAATAPWVTLTAGSSGRGSATLRAAVTDNWDAPRVAGVTVRNELTGPAAEVRIAQGGCRYWVSDTAFQVIASGSTHTFDVLQQSEPASCGGPLQNACRWSAQPTVAWITILTPMPRSGDDRVSFRVDANPGGGSRAGTIVVRDQVVTITQAGPPHP
jgi:hypothetical protein